MRAIDFICKPFDSYWKKKYLGMKREHGRAESNLRYSESLREEQEHFLDELSEKDKKQSKAINAFAAEREEQQLLVETLQRQIGEYQQRYVRAEREKRELEKKLEDARRNLAQEYDNRDGLIEDISALSVELSDYRELCARRAETIDERDAMLQKREREIEELRGLLSAANGEEGERAYDVAG